MDTFPNDDDDPQITFIYLFSTASLPPPQPQLFTSPLTQSSICHSLSSKNNSANPSTGSQWNPPSYTELIQFLSLNQYNLIFVQESHLSFDSTFQVLGYKTLRKDRSMTKSGTTNSTRNLGGGVLILVKNGLICSPLSTQHLFLLDACSNYLPITV